MGSKKTRNRATKQNSWWKAYARAETVEERREMLRDFIQVVVNAYYDFYKSGKDVKPVLKGIDEVAKKIAKKNRDINGDGWTIDRDWWACGFAQMTRKGATDAGKWNEVWRNSLRDLYSQIGWDLDESLKPSHDNVKSTEKLEFFGGLDENGMQIMETFIIKVHPIGRCPVGTVWESTKGSIWRIQASPEGKEKNGFVYLTDEDTGRKISLTEGVVLKMRRRADLDN